MQQPPSLVVEHVCSEHSKIATQSAFAEQASLCALHSFEYAPVVLLVHSLQVVYIPLPLLLDELDDEAEPPPPPVPELPVLLDEPVVSPDELLDELELVVVLVPVGSTQPNPMSAHEVAKTPSTKSPSFMFKFPFHARVAGANDSLTDILRRTADKHEDLTPKRPTQRAARDACSTHC